MSSLRFREKTVELAGISGENIDVETADPINYHQAISATASCAGRVIDGKLFMAPAGHPQPVVMIVPGSLGVGPNHLAHAATLIEAGLSVFILDPFGSRSVASTVADQTQYSFAASGYDVVAALIALAADERVDSRRISAQGHSRGGAAVLTASMRRFVDPIAGNRVGLAGTYAVYPWCGHIFRSSDVGTTVVRAIVGDRDDWLSSQQVQGQVHAIASTGASASVRIVAGAGHSFDRLQALEFYPDAAVAPHAPAVFIEHDGSMTSPYFDGPSAALTDRDAFVAAMKAGHGVKGATIGSTGDQPEIFRNDMLAFHRRVLG